MITVRCRPLDKPWRGPETVDRKPHPFRATWQDTLDLVDRELRALDAEVAVLEAGFIETDLRVDGWPRSNARQPDFPGVRLSFDTSHGRLVYATDVYGPSWNGRLHAWQANLRAIGLGLEALRAVDRHGITRSGEQYTGFRAIGAGTSTPPPTVNGHWYWRSDLEDVRRWEPPVVLHLLDGIPEHVTDGVPYPPTWEPEPGDYPFCYLASTWIEATAKVPAMRRRAEATLRQWGRKPRPMVSGVLVQVDPTQWAVWYRTQPDPTGPVQHRYHAGRAWTSPPGTPADNLDLWTEITGP